MGDVGHPGMEDADVFLEEEDDDPAFSLSVAQSALEGNNGAGRRGTYQSLLWGVTGKAISDFVRYRDSPNRNLRRLSVDAEWWLFAADFSGNPRDEPLVDAIPSFAWVCYVLDQDVKQARSRIRRMQITDLPKVDRRRR